jgi:tripeptidyl-peptidase-1
MTSLTSCRYHVPSHIQEHVDYITPGVKVFAPERPGNSRRDIEKRGNYQLPPLLNSLDMSLEALLAIPELLGCSVAITPPCVQSMYSEFAITLALR